MNKVLVFFLLLSCLLVLSCSNAGKIYYDDALIARQADSVSTIMSVQSSNGKRSTYSANSITGCRTLINRNFKGESLMIDFSLEEGLGKIVLVKDKTVTVLCDSSVSSLLIKDLNGKCRIKVVGIDAKLNVKINVVE